MEKDNIYATFISLGLVAVLGGGLLYGGYRWGDSDEKEFSAVLHEEATVVETIHTPATHETQVLPKGSGFGIDIGGGLEIHVNHIPETFGVMFRCQHGEFVVDRKELYDKLSAHKGRRVEVSYREVYKTSYRGAGKYKKLVTRSLEKYDFLDAQLK